MLEELMAKVEKIMAETDSKRDGAVIQLVGQMSLDEKKAVCDKFDLDYNPTEEWTLTDVLEGKIIAGFVKRDRMAQIAAKRGQ